jgi:hypothetical protein
LVREPIPLCDENLRDIVDAGRINPRYAKQSLEGEFDHLLRFSHNVCPTLAAKEDVKRLEANRRPTEIVGC